jgi:hypothetical protein
MLDCFIMCHLVGKEVVSAVFGWRVLVQLLSMLRAVANVSTAVGV